MREARAEVMRRKVRMATMRAATPRYATTITIAMYIYAEVAGGGIARHSTTGGEVIALLEVRCRAKRPAFLLLRTCCRAPHAW